MSQLGGSVVIVEMKKTQSVGNKRQSLYKKQFLILKGTSKKSKTARCKKNNGDHNTRENHLEGSRATQTTQHL